MMTMMSPSRMTTTTTTTTVALELRQKQQVSFEESHDPSKESLDPSFDSPPLVDYHVKWSSKNFLYDEWPKCRIACRLVLTSLPLLWMPQEKHASHGEYDSLTLYHVSHDSFCDCSSLTTFALTLSPHAMQP